MQLAGMLLGPTPFVGLPAASRIRARHKSSAINAPDSELKPDAGRNDGPSGIWLRLGSCPKCGKRKIKRRRGKRQCPHCGPLPEPQPKERA